MIHIEDLKRIDFTKMDGLEQTAPVRMASKVIGFPEDVYRLITDDERRKERHYKCASRYAVVSAAALFWFVVWKLCH